MNRQERLAAILDLLGSAGSVGVDELVESFDISPATARRDLDVLAEQRLLARTRGGANTQSVAYDLPLRYKRDRHAAEKARIADAVQQLIEPGATVGLSGGTTTTAIAAVLAVREDLQAAPEPLTVVTNAINIAGQLAIRNHIRVVVSGGVVQPRSYELVGSFTDVTLKQLTLDIAFIGVNGLDAHEGPTVHDEREAQVNALMASRAKRAWIVADASKIGQRAFTQVGDLSSFEGVVTDSRMSDDQRAALVERGLHVIVA